MSGHKSCPWEAEVLASQSSTLSPSRSTLQKPDTAWLERPERVNKWCGPDAASLSTSISTWGLSLHLSSLPRHVPGRIIYPGKWHKVPWCPFDWAAPLSEQSQSHWLLLITSLTGSTLTGAHRITNNHSWKTWNQPMRDWNKRLQLENNLKCRQFDFKDQESKCILQSLVFSLKIVFILAPVHFNWDMGYHFNVSAHFLVYISQVI